MQVACPTAWTSRQGDRLLAVVPMFHANAWGLPYAALMAGATLVMPDRFLQAEPLAAMIETEQVDRRAAPCRRSGTTCCATSTSTRGRRLDALARRSSSAARPARRR